MTFHALKYRSTANHSHPVRRQPDHTPTGQAKNTASAPETKPVTPDYARAEAKLRTLAPKAPGHRSLLSPDVVKTFARMQNTRHLQAVSGAELAKVVGFAKTGSAHQSQQMENIARGKFDDASMAFVANHPQEIKFFLDCLEMRRHRASHTTEFGTPEERKKLIADYDRVKANFERAKTEWPKKNALNLLVGKVGTEQPLTPQERKRVLRHPELLRAYFHEMKSDYQEHCKNLKNRNLTPDERRTEQVLKTMTQRSLKATRKFMARNHLA